MLIKRFAALVALLLFVAYSLWSMPKVIIDVTGPTAYQRWRIHTLASELHFADEKMVPHWRIEILSTDDWDVAITRYKVQTWTAFTVLETATTYVSEDDLIFAHDDRVRQTLAHEAGHLICGCSSEETANAIAWRLQVKVKI